MCVCIGVFFPKTNKPPRKEQTCRLGAANKTTSEREPWTPHPNRHTHTVGMCIMRSWGASPSLSALNEGEQLLTYPSVVKACTIDNSGSRLSSSKSCTSLRDYLVEVLQIDWSVIDQALGMIPTPRCQLLISGWIDRDDRSQVKLVYWHRTYGVLWWIRLFKRRV